MKISKYYLLFFTGVILFLTTTAYLSKEKSPYVKKEMSSITHVTYDNSKIIKFDHKLHVKDAGVKCEECHSKALASVSSKDNLNPKKKDCEGCHDVKDTKTCNLCHYDNVYKKLQASDRELVFSHKDHVKDQKCTDCHKGLEEVKFSAQGVSSGIPTMESCYSCHNNEKASNNCETCHSNLTNLTPSDHLKTNFLNEHTMAAGVNSKNNCMMCHSDNFCQTCHSPLNYNGENKSDNFYAPYYTKDNGTRTDRGELQKLTTAHNLNYLYTHGLDANQKSFECNTCHNPADFCSSCHQNGGNTITGIAPESHQQPNFATMDVSSGGGLHSQLARRDIESCQSCHNVAGQDPVCVQCHLNPNIINGKDIK